MAIVEIQNPSSVSIKFDCGKNNEGKTITKIKSYGSIKPEVSGENVHFVASVLASLQDFDVMDIVKKDSTSLNA